MPGRRGRYTMGQGFAQRFTPNRESPQARGVRWWWPTLGSRGTNRVRNYAAGFGNAAFPGGASDPAWSNVSQLGTVLQYDGNDYLTAGLIDMSGWAAISVAAWVNYDSSGTDEHTIVSNWRAIQAAAVLFRLEPADDTVEGFVVVQADTQIGGTFVDLVLTPNTWHHVAWTYSGPDGLRAYLDGRLSTTTFAGGGAALDPQASANDFEFGRSPHAGSDYLTGFIGDVRMAAVAWTPSEVRHQFAYPWDLYKTPPRMWARVAAGPVVGNPWYNYAQM